MDNDGPESRQSINASTSKTQSTDSCSWFLLFSTRRQVHNVVTALWERWRDPSGNWIKTSSILTTTPNAVTSSVRDRMPVILDRINYDLWLDPGFTDVKAASELLKPYAARLMRCYPISTRINHAANDDSECAKPIELEAPPQARLFA